MQKLGGSLKLLLQIARNHSPQSHQFKNLFFDCSSQPNLIKHLHRSHLHEHPSFSHSLLNSRPSWRPNSCNVSDRIRGFLANPKNVYSQNWRRILLDNKVQFLRSQFPMRNFNNLSGSSHFGWRSWFPSAEGTVWRLIAANAAVFMLWRVADPSFMRRNFTISVENFRNGRIHTLITAAFSHIEIEHLLSNMIGLYFFGNSIGRMFGPEYVMKLYLAGAVVGSIFYLLHHAFMAPSSKGSGIWYVDPSRIPGMELSK